MGGAATRPYELAYALRLLAKAAKEAWFTGATIDEYS